MAMDSWAREDTDAALVTGLRSGDEGAIDALVRTYGDRVRRLGLSITGSPEEAEEVAQDALWQIARRIDTFRGESAFGTWVYRVTANAALMRRRASAARVREESLDALAPDGDEAVLAGADGVRAWREEDPAVLGERRRMFVSALDQLGRADREALVMHDVEGRSNPDIAAALGISLPAVKSRVHRSRRRLRARLAPYLEIA